MANERSLVWLASSAPPPGRVRVEALDERAAVGLTAGDDAGGLTKRAPNEDSLALLRRGARYFAIVADAHFGPSSSEVAIGALVRAIDRAPSDVPLEPAALLAWFRAAIATAEDERPYPDSETTVLCAVIEAARMSWISVGDSYLFRLRADRPVRRLNRVSASYLGLEELDRLDVDAGTADLAPGDAVLLATDGIDAETSGLELVEVAEIVLGEVGPLDAVSTLIARAGFAEHGGGGDNLALAVIAVPSP